jgi:hypothetical protein
LVDPKDIDTLSSELENRLDDLFGENGDSLPDAQDKPQKELYPLAELKNLILSIDWEITDEVLNNLIQQLKDLQLTYTHDKIVTTFLQILNSLGNYIKTHRARAHPKTFKILNSVFSSLDKVVLNKDMTDSAKKKILRAEMNRYKELRTQIAKNKTAAAQRKKTSKPAIKEAMKIEEIKEAPVVAKAESAEKPADAVDEELILSDQPQVATVNTLAEAVEEEIIPSNQPQVAAVTTLAEAVEEIKRYLHMEISAIKEEIQSLRRKN